MLSFLSLLAISEIGDNFYHHYNNGTHKLDGWYSVDYIMEYSGDTHTQYSTDTIPGILSILTTTIKPHVNWNVMY